VRAPRRLVVIALALVFAPVLVAASGTGEVSLARLTDAAAPTLSVTTDTLDPPTSLTASGGTSASLSWTATVDTYATGYDVLRGSVSGGPYSVVGSVAPRTTVTTGDTPPTSGTWYYVLRSVFQSWTSVNSNQASAAVTLPSASTGFKACTAASNAADTGGDNNGYETAAGSACAPDGAVATDVNSGTTLSTSCADAGKDRHRFWDFGLGVPVGAAAILGIEVQVTAAKGNNGSNALLCAQLSWDGGTTWTATKSTPGLTTTSTAFTLGAANDLWGRAWTGSELSNTNFRVRVIDVSDKSNQDLKLDGLTTQVTYMP
jgi:hypothetical protein